MAITAIDRIKNAASELTTGAVVVGRALGAKALSTARPVLTKANGAVRTTLDRSSSPTPVAATPVSAAESAAGSAAERAAESVPDAEAAAPVTAPVPVPRTSPEAPTPAAVAKNIPPHPPAATSGGPKPARKPAKKSVPGAKLPVSRTATEPGT